MFFRRRTACRTGTARRAVRCCARRPSDRKGALLSLELLLTLPILLALCFGTIEMGMLLMGMQRVQSAADAACRAATLPSADAAAVQAAAVQTLAKNSLVQACTVDSTLGVYPGDPVTVKISVPMSAAAPNLLAIVGFSLSGRYLTAQTQMSKQ